MDEYMKKWEREICLLARDFCVYMSPEKIIAEVKHQYADVELPHWCKSRDRFYYEKAREKIMRML